MRDTHYGRMCFKSVRTVRVLHSSALQHIFLLHVACVTDKASKTMSFYPFAFRLLYAATIAILT